MKTASSIVFLTTLALLALGMVALVSASAGHSDTRPLIIQPIACAIGLIGCGLAAWKDYRYLRFWSWYLLAGAVILLVAVLVPGLGKTTHGATRWLIVGPFRLQPSECAKLALVIALAHYGAYYQNQMKRAWRGLIIPAAIMAPVLGLVFVEPDVGATLLIGAVGVMMLVLAGTRLRYVVPPATVAMAGLAIFLINDPNRSARIHSWLNLEATKQGSGLQAYQSITAIGKGGVNGVGLGDGLYKLGFIPEHHTDFILSVIGEEMGLMATLTIVLAFLALVLAGVYIAWHARETFGMLVAAGITFLIGIQAIINIGVVTGALPNKGLALPFISYGGSNLVMLLTSVGLLLNVARHGLKQRKISEHPLPPNEVISYQFI